MWLMYTKILITLLLVTMTNGRATEDFKEDLDHELVIALLLVDMTTGRATEDFKQDLNHEDLNEESIKIEKRQDDKACYAPDLHTDEIYNYRYHPAKKSMEYIYFEVQAQSDVHIGLSPEARDADPMYEIVISGWGNTQSAIKRCKGCPTKVTAPTSGILNRNEWHGFWITYDMKTGKLEVGKKSQGAFMTWIDPSPINVMYLGYTTGWGSDGRFRFCRLFDLPGQDGAQGPAGPQGIAGPTGPTGPQGIAGPTGPSGLQGIAGPTGPAGSNGTAGPKGQAGQRGSDGAPGKDGSTGQDGPQGPVGSPGTAGPKGSAGSPGKDGSTGQAGPRGSAGSQGTTGLTGPAGPRGSAGSPGKDGSTGQAGPQGLPGKDAPDRGTTGMTYVRWGRTVCNDDTAQLVYKGITGGSGLNQKGNGGNYLCLPEDPEFDYTDGPKAKVSRGLIYSAEYQMLKMTDGTPLLPLHDQEAPCVVCHVSNRGSLLMIPAKMTCPEGWTKEYHGYLMSQKFKGKGPTEFICVDHDPQIRPNSQDKKKKLGALLYPVEGRCDEGALPCDQYPNGHELTCVVCTK